MLEDLYMFVVSGLSLAFFAGVAFKIWNASGSNWRLFSSAYPLRAVGEPIATKVSGAARVGVPGKAWGVYSGDTKANHLPPVRLSLFEKGMMLSCWGPFHHGQPSMYLPFDEMRLRPAKMGLIECYGVQMRAVPNLAILLYDTLLEWAAEHSPDIASMLRRAALGMDDFADRSGSANVGFGRRPRTH